MAATIARPPVVDSVTLHATAGTATAITLHKDTRRVRLYSTAALSIARVGTDAVAIGADAVTYAAGVAFDYPVASRGRNLEGTVLYIAADANSAVMKIEASDVL